jgi:hypothetical protein
MGMTCAVEMLVGAAIYVVAFLGVGEVVHAMLSRDTSATTGSGSVFARFRRGAD